MKKRILSVFIAVIMVICAMPMTALAGGDDVTYYIKSYYTNGVTFMSGSTLEARIEFNSALPNDAIVKILPKEGDCTCTEPVISPDRLIMTFEITGTETSNIHISIIDNANVTDSVTFKANVVDPTATTTATTTTTNAVKTGDSNNTALFGILGIVAFCGAGFAFKKKEN